MKTLTLVSAPKSPAASAKWRPDLYLKKGRMLLRITPEQCSVVRERYNAGRGSSEIRIRDSDAFPLYDVTGAKIGYVSYNGRVWLHDVEGDIEVPQQGVKTAAQHASEGWKDFIR
jgi:hypothetical protein